MIVPVNPPAYVSLQPADPAFKEASFNVEGKRYVVSLREAKTNSQRALFRNVRAKDFSAIINLFDGLLPAERQPFLINFEQNTGSDLLLGLARRGISRDTLRVLCESIFGSRSWDAALAWEDVIKAVKTNDPGTEGKFRVAQFFTKGSGNQPGSSIVSYGQISKIYRALRCLEGSETTLAHDLLEIRRSYPESNEISLGTMGLIGACHRWLSAGKSA